ncbi:MAG TPA: 50S ribosomal protein L11 methyltransferase [Desulfobacteraceae bacterium]|nr:50S ribosomal protein L11 methyltransferase [Desulfobacteraceae bacterium]
MSSTKQDSPDRVDRKKPGRIRAEKSVPGAPDWVRISISADPEAHEAAGAFLFDLGCEGIVEEGREVYGYLPWNRSREDLSIELNALTARLNKFFPSQSPASAALSPVAEENWAENWREFFKPERVSAGLIVYPAWIPVPAQETGHVILMDPGPAFGTGKHPTTRLCLREIERLSTELGAASFLDVGTGSAILAVYAANLGFKPVIGIDIDIEALDWAEQNIALNGLDRQIVLSEAPIQAIKGRYRVVVANIILGEILKILPHLIAKTDDGGRIVISGILGDQIAEVESQLSPGAARSLIVHTEDEWACLTVEIEHGGRRQ